MKDELTIKRTNVIKAMEEGCADVQATLSLLFPDITKEDENLYYTIIETPKIDKHKHIAYQGNIIDLLQIGHVASPLHLQNNGKSIFLKAVPQYRWELIDTVYGASNYSRLLILKKQVY